MTEAGDAWDAETLAPYLQTLADLFTTERLIWGSDWPVVDLAGGFDAWWRVVSTWTADLSEASLSGILGGNARRFYGL